MKNGKRDYQAEKAWDHKHGTRLKDRAERNKARAMEMKAGRVHKGDGKDVDHRKPISKGGKTTMGNLRVVSAHKNRSYPRKRDGSMR